MTAPTAPTARQIVAALSLRALPVDPARHIERANDAAKALLGPGLVGRHFVLAPRRPVLMGASGPGRRERSPI